MDLKAGMQVDASWLDAARAGEGPIYLRLVRALAAAIDTGVLAAGDRLPPQRTAAARLGVDLTTVSRAYAHAQALGLVEGATGRGTFVRAQRREDDGLGPTDLSMNLPAPLPGGALARRLSATLHDLLAGTDVDTLMSYHVGAITAGQARLAQSWLAPCLGAFGRERLLIAPGAQAALHAIIAARLAPGDTLLVEPLAYPGLLAVARQSGVALAAAPVDAEGVRPDLLEEALGRTGGAHLCLCPTFQNPTAATLSLARRQEIAAVLRRTGATLIEDDAYGRLPAAPLPAIARFAPERAFYVATVSKTLSPGLRVAYVVAPDAAAAERLSDTLRATSLMPSPLTVALVSRWIRDGQAEAVLRDMRAEAVARRAVAAAVLPTAQGGAESLHVWLDLAPGADEQRIRAAARDRGLALVTSTAFCPGPSPRPGVRLSLGGARTRAALRTALEDTARIVSGQTAPRAVI